jgi:hypothetical protein
VMLLHSAHRHRAEAPTHGREWHDAERPNAFIADELDGCWESFFLLHIRADHGVLVLQNPPSDGLLYGKLDAGLEMSRAGGLQELHTHDAPVRVMQDQRKIREVENLRQLLGEVAEQTFQIVMRGDRLRHLKQCTVPSDRCFHHREAEPYSMAVVWLH